MTLTLHAWSGTAFLLSSLPIFQDGSVTLEPVKDNTLIEENSGALSNGTGPIFAGRVGPFGGETLRRALLRFDVAGSIPAGSVIDDVTLTLHVAQSVSGATPMTLHRLLADWGEGTSFATGGTGALSTPGDATWIHTFFPGSLWAMPGGDFDATVSATAAVAGVGFYDWSAPGMVADVQGWLDDDSANHGWMVRGDESTPFTAKKFDSRESVTGLRPALTIQYSMPPECFLVFGSGPGAEAFAGGLHTWESQLADLQYSYAVTLDELPTFPLLGTSPHRKASRLPEPVAEFAVQILMWNPQEFPANPEQWSHGLRVTQWSNGRVTGVPFGAEDGMQVGLETVIVDGERHVRFPFTIDGI